MENLLLYLLVGAGVALASRKDELVVVPQEPIKEPDPILPGPTTVNLIDVQAPTGLIRNGNRLSWQAVSGADGYKLRVHRMGTVYDPCESMVFCDDVQDTFHDLSFESGQTYDWWVHAVRGGVVSEAAGASFMILLPAPIPVPVVIVPNPPVIVPVIPIIPVVIPTPTLIPSGSVIFVLDYNKFNSVESILGTGPGSKWQSTATEFQLDGSKTFSLVNDPLGQKGRVLEIRYVGPHDNPACLVNGIVPNYVTDPHGFYDVYLRCIDSRNGKLWLEWGAWYGGVPEVQTIIEEYDVLYLPIDSSQPWGPKYAKQHYWRGTTQNQMTVFSFEEDRYMRTTYYKDSVESQAPAPRFNRVNTKDQRWHHVKAIFKNSDPGQNNGLQELWIDGQLQSSVYNIKDTGNKWNGIHNYRQGSDNLRRLEANWVVTSG